MTMTVMALARSEHQGIYTPAMRGENPPAQNAREII
jgi:hypothetical protein